MSTLPDLLLWTPKWILQGLATPHGVRLHPKTEAILDPCKGLNLVLHQGSLFLAHYSCRLAHADLPKQL